MTKKESVDLAKEIINTLCIEPNKEIRYNLASFIIDNEKINIFAYIKYDNSLANILIYSGVEYEGRDNIYADYNHSIKETDINVLANELYEIANLYQNPIWIYELKELISSFKTYYLIQSYKTEKDDKYYGDIYPSYLTSYDLTLGGKNFGLQTNMYDAVKFSSKDKAKIWLKYAVEHFPNRTWDIIPVDERLFGKNKPLYIIE